MIRPPRHRARNRDPNILLHLQAAALTPVDICGLVPQSIPSAQIAHDVVMAFDYISYSHKDFLEYHGLARGEYEWDFAYRVRHDVGVAIERLNSLTKFLRIYANEHPAVSLVRDRVFELLFDPTKPAAEARLDHLFLQPLWIRREVCELQHGIRTVFTELLSNQDTGDAWNACLA